VFNVDEITLGRISWYYETVAGTKDLNDLGYPHFTPFDVGARWISSRADWQQDTKVLTLSRADTGFARHLAHRGCLIVTKAKITRAYAAGAYLIADVDEVLEMVSSGAFDELHARIFPFGKLLLAIQMPFASNVSFEHVGVIAEAETQGLGLSRKQFETEIGAIEKDVFRESPALLSRLLLQRLRVSTEPSYEECLVERFVFEPDFMTTPVGERVVSLDAARRLQFDGGDKTDRKGILLLSLSRTARI